MNLEKLVHNTLLKLNPETAHNLGKIGIKHKLLAPGEYISEKKPMLFNHEINNPLGLAAGFDKNGQVSDQIINYGFGWEEVGSVSFYGSKGNPKPRLFRLENGSLLNRMGLNGSPVEEILLKLVEAKNPFAVNIVKTPDEKITGDFAIEDIRKTYKIIKETLESHGKLIYVALNLSCPNTKDGKTFEEPKNLNYLLEAIEEVKGKIPYLIKLSPNLEQQQVREIVEVAEDRVSGYICGNTFSTYSREHGKGGLSGEKLKWHTQELIKNVNNLTTKIIIACGGISSGKDILIAEYRGADFFQVFTGFVYGKNAGPSFAHKILKEYEELKKPVVKR